MSADERGLALMTWLDENWQTFDSSRGVIAAAMQKLRPPPNGKEQDWLAAEWLKRHEDKTAEQAHGAPAAAEGSAPADGEEPGADPAHEPEPNVIVDAETGEIIEDEDIPFVLDDDDAPPAAGTDLELAPRAALVNLFGEGDVDVALAYVEMYATRLLAFVQAHDLTLEMEDGTPWLLSPGWAGLGQLTGTFAKIVHTEQIAGGWKASAIAVRRGDELASHDAVCLRAERGKNYMSDNELLQTAQTRARRGALKDCLSIIVDAAGIDSTPLDERKASPRQIAALMVVLEKLSRTKASKRTKAQWKDWTTEKTLARYGKRISGLTAGEWRQVIDGMQRKLDDAEAASADPEEKFEPDADELAEAGVEVG